MAVCTGIGYVIISQKDFPFLGTITVPNLKGGTKHWQKEWQVSIKKDVLPAEYVKILVRWQRLKCIVGVMR